MPQSVTAFGGRAGAMLSRTTSVASVFTGVVFLAAVAVVAALAGYAPHDLIPAMALHFLISFFVAHFAMEGYSGEWERAGRPIPPGRVGNVALRYMTLSLVLLVPFAFVAPWRDAGLSTVTTPTIDAVLLLVYVLIVVIAPPALLVVSVSAPTWGDLLSPRHWGSRFRGRGGDFFLIYVVFVGALFCVLIAGLPIVSLAGMSSAKAMMLAAAAVAAFATGFSISLLGRLCGSFAAIQPDAPVEKPAPVLHPSLARLERAEAARPAAGGGVAGSTTARAAGNAAGSATPVPGRKTALLDASAKVEELRARHGADAAAFATALHELDQTVLPNPAVRHALVMALVSAARIQEAVALAREAIPLCIRSGNLGAAALMCEALLETGDPLGMTKEQLVSIGDTLKGMKRSVAAVDVYSRVLRLDPTDVKATKGTIAIAQDLGHQKETAAMAVRIYDALIAKCSASPLLDFMKEERTKASRKADS